METKEDYLFFNMLLCNARNKNNKRRDTIRVVSVI
jgi:hypothetical protein